MFPSLLRLKGDPVVWVVFFALCIISLIEVFSATSMLSYGKSFLYPLLRQACILGVGTLVCVCIHHVRCNHFKFLIVGWPIIVVLLLVTALTGGEVNGTSRWAEVAGITFQPSEPAKGILIATIALVLSRCREGSGVNKQAIKYIAIFTLPIALIIFKDNISTAVFLCGVIYVMMYVAGVPTRQMLTLLGAGIAILLIGLATLRSFPDQVDDPFYKSSVGSMFKRMPTAKSRIFGKSLILTEDPDSLVVTDKNMQVVHARIAASCNNHGIGLMPGNSVERDYLPQAYSDFIFAIIIEETGIWGSGIVLLLYLVLMFRTGVMARKCGQNFNAFLVMGLGILLVGQALLNMFVAIGLGPVTGQTLPLISRGGTSTIITCIYFGIIQSIAWSGQKTPDKASEVIPAERGDERSTRDYDIPSDSTED